MHEELCEQCFETSSPTSFIQTGVGVGGWRVLQLKDGEESEVNGMTFTVELRVRTVRVNGAERQSYTSCAVLVAPRFWWSLCKLGEEGQRTRQVCSLLI